MSNTDTVRNFLANNYHDAYTPAAVAKAVGLETKQVSSVLSRLAKKGEILKNENGYHAPAPVTEESKKDEATQAALEEMREHSPEPVEEDLIGDVTPEVLYYEQIDFPGNYSIVTAPLALEIAAAAGVPAKSENVKGKLNRVVSFGGDDMDKAAKVKALVEGTVADALAELKVWQKKHADRRRGLTDMQRYVEHREFIAKHGSSVARSVKKNGLPQ
jgi:hypothetical protein